jgi:hypothetical protein
LEDPEFNAFLKGKTKKVHLDVERSTTALFQYWRKLYFMKQLGLHREKIAQEKGKQGCSFIEAQRAGSAAMKDIQLKFETDYLPNFGIDSLNVAEVIRSLTQGTLSKDQLPEFTLFSPPKVTSMIV